MTRPRISLKDSSRIETADASREIWISTLPKRISEAASPRSSGDTPQGLRSLFSCYSGGMSTDDKKAGKLSSLWRALVEVGFIIFLFYSNLLMGEFIRSSSRGKTLEFAIRDIFTLSNFEIAMVSGLIGYVVFEYLRKQV
jgi:hypothetical protein